MMKMLYSLLKMNAVDYLSKPVNPERLREAIERVKIRENKPKSETRMIFKSLANELEIPDKCMAQY